MPRKIEISHRTIIFTVLFLISLWFLYQIREIVVALFFSLIFMSALNPAVNRLEGWRLPRWLAILLIYLVIIVLVGTALALVITPLIDQTASFINKTAGYLEQFNGFIIDPNVIAGQLSQLGNIPANILKFTVDVFSNIVAIVALAVITFYMLLERKSLDRYLTIFLGKDQNKEVEAFISQVEKRLGGWVRGELTLMTIIGVMTYVGLRLLGVDYALPLAILSGLLEIVPNIGPIVSAIPAVLTGLTISPVMALAIVALYFLIHQTENSLVVPKVMQKVVGINPLITLLSLATGFKLYGVTGAILAIPVVLIVQVILAGVSSSKRFRDL